MYDYHEKERAPDLESVLADFMTYQASSKGDCYSMQQQGTQFEKDYSFADYQWESEWQPYYHNEAEGLSNLDDLLMQFKGTLDSTQQGFKRAETQIGKLVDIKEFASMQPLSNKKENDEIFIKLVRISGPTFALNL